MRDIRGIMTVSATAATFFGVVVLLIDIGAPAGAQSSPQVDVNPRDCAPVPGTTGRSPSAEPAPGTEQPSDFADRMARSSGVICPPPEVDPGIVEPPPQGGTMRVIPPTPPSPN